MKTKARKSDLIREERQFLDKVYNNYDLDTAAQTREMRKLIVRTFAPYLRGRRALELGCSDGFMTEMIAGYVDQLDVVDGSKRFLTEARKRNLGNVKFIYSLFEEFESDAKYDYVVASYILEHVRDPIPVLEMAKSVLRPEGLLLVIVPNARALSRQLALHMGLIKDLKDLTENDLSRGHRRVYDRVALNRDIAAAGFENISQGGIMLKILADFQMDRLIDDGVLQEQQLEGLYRLGLEYPDLSGSLFSVCRIQA